MKSHKYNLLLEVTIPSSQLQSFEGEVEKSLEYAMLSLKNKGYKVLWTLERSPTCFPFSSRRRKVDFYNKNSQGWLNSDEL